MLVYVAKLTIAPGAMTATDAARLTEAGFDDTAILDVVQVAACFAYMNRLADGTGVQVEPRHHEVAIDLFGAEALQAHLRWGEPAT